MNNLNPTESLQSSILALEQKRDSDFYELKQQLRVTGNSLKPANLIRGAIQDVKESPRFKSVLIKAAIGLAAGLVVRRLMKRKGKQVKNNVAGTALEYGLSYLTAQRGSLIKTAGLYAAGLIVKKIFKNRQNHNHHAEVHE